MVSSDDGHGSLRQGKEQIPYTATNAVEENVNPASVDMEAYTRENPLWKRVWRHSLTQMMLLSVQAFCGPAMSDAIAGKNRAFKNLVHGSILMCNASGLGGGGLATPQTSNIA